MRAWISYLTRVARKSRQHRAKIPFVSQTTAIASLREPMSRNRGSESVMNRTSISAIALSCACGLVACSADETPDGSLRGELRIANISYQDGRTEREFYLAPEGSEELTRLVFPRNPEIPALTPLKVWGTLDGEHLVVDRYEVDEKKAELVAETTEPLLNGVKRTRTVGFVLMDIGGGVDLTVAQAQTAAFGTRGASNASLREYYLEASYNTLEFTGQVFETDVTLPSGCSTSQLLNIANNWDTQFGVQLDHWMGYIGSDTDECGWGGVGWEGSASSAQAVSFYNASDSCVVLAQEIGHNLGWMHNGTMDCGNEIMPNNPSSCSGNEYGSRISPMGGACLHLNAYDKWYQGFFGRCNGVRVPGSGTVTLLPIEIPCDGVQGIQIPMPTTRSFRNSSGGSTISLTRYYLELRTKRGLDNKSAIPGPRVFVHVGPDFGAANRSSTFNWVLDMDPSTSGFDGMDVGDTFTDPAGGVSFTVSAMDNDRATITVNNTNGSGSPTCMDGSAFTAPGPTSCGTPTGGTGGMGGTPGGGMGGMPGGGMGGRPGGTGGMPGGGMAGTPGGGMAGATVAGQGGMAGFAGALGGAAGAAGLAGSGGAVVAGAGGAFGAGSGGAPVAGSAGAGVSGAAGIGASGMAGAVTGTGGSIAGAGPGPFVPEQAAEDPAGCGCRTAPTNRASTAWWAFALVGLGWLRRRRAGSA
jgi:MYXO-CTERM domain-containing protein